MIDLNVLWPGSSMAMHTADVAYSLGWSKIAFNIYFKLDRCGIHQIIPRSTSLNYCSTNTTTEISFEKSFNSIIESTNPLTGHYFCSNNDKNGKVPRGCAFLKRATVVLLENFQPTLLNKIAESDEFDIVAVIPTDQRSFDMACDNLNCDLINLSAYCFFEPYKIRRGKLTNAIKRGCFFELSMPVNDIIEQVYMPQVQKRESGIHVDFETNYRSQLPSVLRHVPLKKLVMSQGSTNPKELSSPDTQIGMWNALVSFVYGKSSSVADCFSRAPKGCINKGAARRTFGTGIYIYKQGNILGPAFISQETNSQSYKVT
ncbi:bifunctional RNase P subunit p30/polymerase-histidinol phosphatase-like [Babesia duncani]|uniref:Bifunctional RNase P subunit p30/polymerase-histidinol phosphatase-like n=1 Tax=Babesia duncani TaxID=323732 RepID=A0AAD9UQF7_9APIC|nr:bifunctional RNase P subunit p30/polymerase-histidinol phosphatase-like [Babesia duncani]